MEFRTIVNIPKPQFEIAPHDEVLLVGSCFADSIGQRFREEGFPVTVNPFGTMYNPASVLHTLEKMRDVENEKMRDSRTVLSSFKHVFLTLGTNHVYREKATGEIVDNCQKRPASLFTEEELTVEQCTHYLQRTVDVLRRENPSLNIVFTVSPIRYRKYGYHESQLSKATLLMAIDRLLKTEAELSTVNCQLSIHYFPAYEIMNDELRDYRFYAADMLHPSGQAVEYIWERLVDTYFSAEARQWLDDWRPVKQALAHRPFDAESEEYRAFMDKTMLKVEALRKKYPNFAGL